MNTVWSKYVQGAGTLYYTRKLRFDDMFFEQYRDKSWRHRFCIIYNAGVFHEN